VIKKGRLGWFKHIGHKNDEDCVKRCMMLEVDRTRFRTRPSKIWWNCIKNDMESIVCDAIIIIIIIVIKDKNLKVYNDV